ncbi:hypothetical protein C5167_015651 [Papaver somniferum]|uniref:Uncharacterized protein n=1 Tax=Papaver somniferum TaxID=3469 RepID=A0A4Y7J7L6_PAPSO|nr:O-acyltransferase WSD1-like [Papaver somniferum]RZC56807.1 hypothetical protein C5167_015651 [Papaver somniferum]
MDGRYNNEANRDEETSPPVSPLSQSLNSSIVSFIVHVVFELETPITELETLEFLRTHLLPVNTRFSSIMERNKNGVLRWKRVGIRVEDHLIVPTFPNGLTRESYDEKLREYLSKIGCKNFSQEKPLWEVHLVKYPSMKGACTMIFKFSHALGDGYSFMRVFFKCCRRADNPSLPLTFPQLSLIKTQQQDRGNQVIGLGKKLLGWMGKCINTSYDLIETMLKTSFLEDRPSAIRYSDTSTELFKPFSVYSVTISLERVKQVRTKLGATVNDVIIGLISYVIHLYMERKKKRMEQCGEAADGLMMDSITNGASNMTLCVMLNTRIFKGSKNLEDMIKAEAWGNHSTLVFAKLPTFPNDEQVNPLDFITKAKNTMDKKKNSMIFYLIDSILSAATRMKGQKGMDEMLYKSFANASTSMSNLIGPKEQIAFMSHPVSSCYYFTAGIPQSTVFTSVTNMDKLMVVATLEKGFIDTKLFTSCMDEAFENIFRAAFGDSQDKDDSEISKKSD